MASFVAAVVAIKRADLDAAAIELMDVGQVRMINQAEGTRFDEHPTLFVELHASDAQALEAAPAALVEFAEAELARRGLTGYLLGHAGDGNVHVLLPYRDEAGYAAVQAFNDVLVEKALALGGTAMRST